jgi:UDP-glucose 4-epimerase
MAPFDGASVLITGGAGFIGSNLAIRLVEMGAQVTLVDAMIPGYGANLFNIDPIRDRVRMNFSDVRDEHVMNHLVRGQDYIFHLAAQVSHVMSLSDPFPDIDINIKGTAVLLEACKHHNRKARIVRAGTRGQYGPASRLPVTEDTPMNPKGIYELSQLTAEKMMQVYQDIHGIRSVNLRLTNIYGERSQMRHSHFGVANWFVRLAIDDQTIKVFGDGTIKRDFLHVSDTVDAFVQTALSEACYGGVFNVGMSTPVTFREFAQRVIDITKISRTAGWQPRVSLDEGLKRTIAYYRQHKTHYWES